jgi:hypothetical protein
MISLVGGVLIMTNHPGRRAREQHVRRLARQQGFRLEKSRIRTPQARGYGGYRLVDVQHNLVAYGGIPYMYCATLHEIERFVRQLPPIPTIAMPEESRAEASGLDD